MTAIIIILTIISFTIWFRYGKDEKTIPVVSFEAPAGLNPAEVELFYKGKITIKGVIALLFYLANKGYLKAVQDNILRICGFEKVKDYDGDNSMEKDLLDALFVSNRVDFYNSDYIIKYYPDYIEKYNDKKRVIFEKTSINPILQKIMYLIFLLTGVFAVLTIGSDIPKFVLALICTTICGICAYNLPKKNRIGLSVTGKIEGLKKFLETTEKHKLRSLIEHNPKQFYEVMPYMLVLEALGHVADLTENVMLNPPDWYDGEKFDINTIRFVTNLLKTVI